MARDIELFLEEDELDSFYEDIEYGQYLEWITKYPDYIESIFLHLWMHYGPPDENTLKNFLAKGMNINGEIIGPECDTFLEVACDQQDAEMIDLLLSNGAIPSKHIVENAIFGHRDGDIKNTENITQCLNVIQKHNIPLCIEKRLYDDLINNNRFDMSHPYYQDFFKKCKISQ